MLFVLLLACSAQAEAEAQEPDRMLLEAGIVGGNSIACPRHYAASKGTSGTP